jgi:hypothetical protein
VGDRPRARALRVRAERSVGNTEGTPARARASTTGYSSSGDSFFLRGFRARGFPALPALPISSLDGKEAVPGSSPGEGLNTCKSRFFTITESLLITEGLGRSSRPDARTPCKSPPDLTRQSTSLQWVGLDGLAADGDHGKSLENAKTGPCHCGARRTLGTGFGEQKWPRGPPACGARRSQ